MKIVNKKIFTLQKVTMKSKLILTIFILAIIPFFANAQKSSYIKNRLTFDASYSLMNNQYNKNLKINGFSLSANYGTAKFLETGLYYAFGKRMTDYHFVGIQNRFHILPFFVNTDNKFFRFDTYISNQTGMYVIGASYDFIGVKNPIFFHTNVGLGAAFYVFRNMAIRFEYRWDFIFGKLNGMKTDPYLQNGFNVGISLKF